LIPKKNATITQLPRLSRTAPATSSRAAPRRPHDAHVGALFVGAPSAGRRSREGVQPPAGEATRGSAALLPLVAGTATRGKRARASGGLRLCSMMRAIGKAAAGSMRGWGLVTTRGRVGQIRATHGGRRHGVEVGAVGEVWAGTTSVEDSGYRHRGRPSSTELEPPPSRMYRPPTEADYCGRACPLPVFHLCFVPSSRRTPTGACLLRHGIWKTCPNRLGCGHVWYASMLLLAKQAYLFFWSVVHFYYWRRSELKQEFYVVCLNQLFISTLRNRYGVAYCCFKIARLSDTCYRVINIPLNIISIFFKRCYVHLFSETWSNFIVPACQCWRMYHILFSRSYNLKGRNAEEFVQTSDMCGWGDSNTQQSAYLTYVQRWKLPFSWCF
jgi:hypothetical protein